MLNKIKFITIILLLTNFLFAQKSIEKEIENLIYRTDSLYKNILFPIDLNISYMKYKKLDIVLNYNNELKDFIINNNFKEVNIDLGKIISTLDKDYCVDSFRYYNDKTICSKEYSNYFDTMNLIINNIILKDKDSIAIDKNETILKYMQQSSYYNISRKNSIDQSIKHFIIINTYGNSNMFLILYAINFESKVNSISSYKELIFK